MIKNISNLGDAAIYCDFGSEVNREINHEVIKYFKTLTSKNIKEVYKHILNKDFYCYMTGFVAGMPFLGDTNKNIRLKRLETPRVKVPKGSVGITEQFCNIYTYESPGGWNIIGNTPVKVFDKNKEENPILIKPGDSVQFYEITKNEFYKIKE